MNNMYIYAIHAIHAIHARHAIHAIHTIHAIHAIHTMHEITCTIHTTYMYKELRWTPFYYNCADPTSELGAIIDKIQFEKILGYINIGKAEGARVVTGGDRLGTTVCSMHAFHILAMSCIYCILWFMFGLSLRIHRTWKVPNGRMRCTDVF